MQKMLSSEGQRQNMNIPNKATFNTLEFANICGVTQRSVYNWINDRKITGVFRVEIKLKEEVTTFINVKVIPEEVEKAEEIEKE